MKLMLRAPPLSCMHDVMVFTQLTTCRLCYLSEKAYYNCKRLIITTCRLCYLSEKAYYNCQPFQLLRPHCHS